MGGKNPGGLGRIVAYTVVVTILFMAAFVFLIAYTPSLGSGDLDSLAPDSLRLVLIMTTALMLVAGVMGGCLYNFRGLVKHSADADYSDKYNISYYLRPISGGLSGLIVFFLVLGGVLAFNLGTGEISTGWATLMGRMPYVALSLLAGYGSHEFMLKLKDLADSLFALSGK